MHISFFQIGHKQNHWLFHLIWDKFKGFIDLQRWVHTATPCFDGTSYPGMTELLKCPCHGSTQLGFHERLQRPQSHVDLGISLYDSKRYREICELSLPSKTKKNISARRINGIRSSILSELLPIKFQFSSQKISLYFKPHLCNKVWKVVSIK